MNPAIEYGIAVASGVTVAIVGAMAVGARNWAKGLTTQVNGLGRRLDRQVQRVDKRVARMASHQAGDRARIVRLETVLLLAPTPAEGARAALDALNEHGGLSGHTGGALPDLGADPLGLLDAEGDGGSLPTG